jgi:hypothetical protein
MSWIDHILSSIAINNMVPFNGIRILNEVDHRPMSFNVQCSVGGSNNANSVISHDYCTVPQYGVTVMNLHL